MKIVQLCTPRNTLCFYTGICNCMQQLTFFHYVNGIFSKLVPLINPISDKTCSARSSLTDKTYSYAFIYMNIDYITL